VSERPAVPEVRRQPGSVPYPDLSPGTDTIPKIAHIVVLMMENHSYDNKLGMLARAGADGLRLGPDGKPAATNPYANGDVQPPALAQPLVASNPLGALACELMGPGTSPPPGSVSAPPR
jgi:hypothetical protein